MNRKPKTPSIIYGPEWTHDGTRERYRCVENASSGLRVTGSADDVLRATGSGSHGLGHTGWYIDNYQSELVSGYVLQLPSRHGGPVYVPAINDPDNADCYTVDFHSTTEDKAEAARWADSMAECYAERERDYRARESAKIEAEDLREQIAALRARHSAAVRELRAVPAGGDTPTLCAMLRASLARMRRDVHQARERIAALTDNYWLTVED